MEFSKQEAAALLAIKDKSADSTKLRDAGTVYWDAIERGIGDCLRNKIDITSFCSRERDFIDFGICTHIVDLPVEIKKKILDNSPKDSFIAVLCFSEWISQLYSKIVQGDKKELLEKEISFTIIQISRTEKEIMELQQQRKDLLFTEQTISTATRQTTDRQSGLELMEQYDALLRQNLKFKKAVSKGTFFSVVDKRKHCERENTQSVLKGKSDAFLESYQPKERAAIKTMCAQIADDFGTIIDYEDAILKMQADIGELIKKKESISPIETEARVKQEIDYIHDLVKLAAKRLHMESCPIMRPDEGFFTMACLHDCINRILEFDPRVFHNDRVAIFGRPTVLLIPGNGNALYDWKNNLIIVPILPYGGNCMASIATGLIEYRIDTDEDKRLTSSYNQLPQHATIRSIFQLRANLTKDYITWMVSEFKGYKNLAKEVRKWFEHEIAPSKNDIYIPSEFHPFVMPAEEFSRTLDSCEARLSQGLPTAGENDLWVGSILHYMRGNFERSIELLKTLVAKNSKHERAYYNLGYICMKLMYKQDALHAFSEYTKLNPQSWYSGVVMEHARKLSIS